MARPGNVRMLPKGLKEVLEPRYVLICQNPETAHCSGAGFLCGFGGFRTGGPGVRDGRHEVIGRAYKAQFLIQVGLQIGEHETVILAGQRHRSAIGARPARATNAVDVILGVVRQV